MSKIILVRHGETIKNIQGKIHKFGDPEILTNKGIVQIEKTAEELKKYTPDTLYCSGEKRARQSAEIISHILNIPLQRIKGLEERNWGDFVNLSFQDIKQKTGMENMDFETRYTFHPPNGESWKEVEMRLLNALNEILSKNKDKTIVLITHGGSIRTLMPTLLGVDKTESYKYDPDNASISVFNYSKGKFTKEIYNNTNHLENT
jgi:broad specificity phosphatase PhoE